VLGEEGGALQRRLSSLQSYGLLVSTGGIVFELVKANVVLLAEETGGTECELLKAKHPFGGAVDGAV